MQRLAEARWQPGNCLEGCFKQFSALVNALNADKVTTLVIVGCNPVYNAPADLNWAEVLKDFKAEGSPPLPVERLIPSLQAMAAILDRTAAEVESGAYLSCPDAFGTLNAKRPSGPVVAYSGDEYGPPK